MKHFIQYNRFAGRDLRPRLSEYKVGVLTTRSRRSMTLTVVNGLSV
jgi:hypothetical protein